MEFTRKNTLYKEHYRYMSVIPAVYAEHITKQYFFELWHKNTTLHIVQVKLTSTHTSHYIKQRRLTPYECQ